jgi:hypothetical protein
VEQFKKYLFSFFVKKTRDYRRPDEDLPEEPEPEPEE